MRGTTEKKGRGVSNALSLYRRERTPHSDMGKMDMDSMPEAVFTIAEYGAIVGALDEALAAIRSLGKSELQAQSMLTDFVTNHYFLVWRAGREDGQSQGEK